MSRTLLGLLATLSLGAGRPASGGAFDWAFIQDGLVRTFDPAAPGGALPLFASGLGSWNTGLDFYDSARFYYYKSLGSQRGLWHFDSVTNVNTLVLSTASLVPSSINDGDVTYHNGRVYVSLVDEPGTGFSLYAFDNLDGVVTKTDIGSTGLGQLMGITVHPLTSVLYGWNSFDDSLYTISTTDATPTLVGPGGFNLTTIGGMDFSEDGSQLLILSLDSLYLADTSDGSLAFAGQFDEAFEQRCTHGH